MSSIIHSLSDLAQSLLEVVWSLFTTAGELVQKTVEFVLHFFSGAINLVVEFFKGLVDLAGGIVGFIMGEYDRAWRACGIERMDANEMAGNIAILAVLAVGFFGFLQYQRQQGKTVQVGNKKLN